MVSAWTPPCSTTEIISKSCLTERAGFATITTSRAIAHSETPAHGIIQRDSMRDSWTPYDIRQGHLRVEIHSAGTRIACLATCVLEGEMHAISTSANFCRRCTTSIHTRSICSTLPPTRRRWSDKQGREFAGRHIEFRQQLTSTLQRSL